MQSQRLKWLFAQKDNVSMREKIVTKVVKNGCTNIIYLKKLHSSANKILYVGTHISSKGHLIKKMKRTFDYPHLVKQLGDHLPRGVL